MSSSLRWLPPWELASICRPPSGPAECPTCFLVGLQGSLDAMLCLLVCRFSDESLTLVGDDGVMGIIFLVEGIIVRTSSCRDISWWKPKNWITGSDGGIKWCSPLEAVSWNPWWRHHGSTCSSASFTSKVSKKTADVRCLRTKSRLEEGRRRRLNLSCSSFLSFLFLSCLLCSSVGGLESKHSCNFWFCGQICFFVVVDIHMWMFKTRIFSLI